MYIYLSNKTLFCASLENVSLYRNSAIEKWSNMACINGRVHLLHVANTGVPYQIFITFLLLQNG